MIKNIKKSTALVITTKLVFALIQILKYVSKPNLIICTWYFCIQVLHINYFNMKCIKNQKVLFSEHFIMFYLPIFHSVPFIHTYKTYISLSGRPSSCFNFTIHCNFSCFIHLSCKIFIFWRKFFVPLVDSRYMFPTCFFCKA